MTANCFPGLNVVDETGTGNRVGILNGGSPTGNFGTNGWTRTDLGDAPFIGWTGYGILHQGQAADRTVAIYLDAVAPATSIELDVALIAKYTDPRGGTTPAEKQANRLPAKPADFRTFAYRMPHGALDVSRCIVGVPSGPLTGGRDNEITMRCEVLDWDADAAVSSAISLAEEPDLSLVLASAPGSPELMLDVPGVTSGPTAGVQQASGSISHEYLFSIGLEDTQSPSAGRYTGLIRVKDPEAAYLPPPTQALDAHLNPLTQGLPIPITYQACAINMQSGSWAAQFHLTPGSPASNPTRHQSICWSMGRATPTCRGTFGGK